MRHSLLNRTERHTETDRRTDRRTLDRFMTLICRIQRNNWQGGSCTWHGCVGSASMKRKQPRCSRWSPVRRSPATVSAIVLSIVLSQPFTTNRLRDVHGSILCDPIKPNPSADWPNPTNPTHGSTQPMDNSEETIVFVLSKNSLPEHIRQSTSIAVFKRSIKTFLLQQISHLAH